MGSASGWGPHRANGGGSRELEGVEMKFVATEQVERADERDRVRLMSLAADVASSAVLLGLVVGFTALLVLPVAIVVGLVF